MRQSAVIEAMTAADTIDALLPQTQCTKCGYAACRPYAEALVAGTADLNQCPPGGVAGVHRLAAALGREPKPLDPAHGLEHARAAALIDEAACIGCTLCIRACPTDAIVGAPKQMHTVLVGACTGCGLCIAPCPVDCIQILPLSALARLGSREAAAESGITLYARAQRWRERYARRTQRLARARGVNDARIAGQPQDELPRPESRQPEAAEGERKRAAIRAAFERARALRAAQASNAGPSGTTGKPR